MLALESNSLRIATRVLQVDGMQDQLKLKDCNGKSPLWHAVAHKRIQAVAFFCKELKITTRGESDKKSRATVVDGNAYDAM